MTTNKKPEEQKNEQNEQTTSKKGLLDSSDFSIIGIKVLSYSEKKVGSKSVIFYEVEITSRITKFLENWKKIFWVQKTSWFNDKDIS